ncbi:MAG: SDR family oxidoreductase [Burkholderiales bacterium]
MIVLVTGSRGFLGRHLVTALQADGHVVIAGVSARSPSPGPRTMAMDFTRDVDAETWLARIEGLDCVINTVGIIAEDGAQTFATVHVAAPEALFAACAARDVRAINVSALGADAEAQTAFHRSKRAADEFLLAHHSSAVVVQPSLVFGPEGASARLFATLATLPLIPLPGRGEQRIQPVHVADAATAIARLVRDTRFDGQRITLVGPAPVAYRDFLAELRRALGLPRARFLAVPRVLTSLGVRLLAAFGSRLATADALAMLERGNTADAGPMTTILGRQPRPVSAFIAPEARADARRDAQRRWLLPLARVSLALVWLAGAATSAGLYPIPESLALLAPLGVTGTPALALLYGGVAVDLAFAVATLAWPRRRLWQAQAAVIVFYTLVISAFLPQFWLHPYGPIVKNLPILALLAVLHAESPR